MGLSIYYKGKFRKGASLSEMIEEVKDVAEAYDWNYHIFETEFISSEFQKEPCSQNIYGITFSPPKCEPIDITFLSNGRMICPWTLELYENSDEKDHSYTICTKTQYSGFITHKIIIDLFRYLNSKYFEEFKLTDESEYWESSDENLLQENFKKYDALMDQFADGLQNTPVNKNETIEEYVVRISKILKSKRE